MIQEYEKQSLTIRKKDVSLLTADGRQIRFEHGLSIIKTNPRGIWQINFTALKKYEQNCNLN